MYKFEVSYNSGTFSKENLPRSKTKYSREGIFEDVWSRDMKENDMKHMNGIKPYVNKYRKNSKREIKAVSSQGEINRSRSKRLYSTSSNRKSIYPQQQSSIISCENIPLINPCYPSSVSITRYKQQQSSEITQIYQYMITLKSYYKYLKTSYNNLVKYKYLATSRYYHNKLAFYKQTVHLRKYMYQYKKSSNHLYGEIYRIKRECFKIIYSEKFKYKKLEYTLQYKYLMIAYLRKYIYMLKKYRLLLSSNNGNLGGVNNVNGYNSNNNNGKSNNTKYQLLQQLNSSSMMSQQDNLYRIFFIQNSAPIFSYETYARLSGNMSEGGNVLVEDCENSSYTPTRMGKDCHKNNKKRSEYEEDSLSFSRDKSKYFDSVHSLLSINNHHNDDQTILTFTKKDVIVLDESFENNCLQNKNYNPNKMQYLSFYNDEDLEYYPYCPTFYNRKHYGGSKYREIISFESLKAKRVLSKSDRAYSKRSTKNSKHQTKRLEIMTDLYPDYKHKEKVYDQHSCDTKKKLSKNKLKNTKKASKSYGLHSSIMSEVLHGSFIKKDSTSLLQSKSHHHSNNSKRK